jgi:hypothetical protein
VFGSRSQRAAVAHSPHSVRPQSSALRILAPPYQGPGSPAAARVLARCGPHCLMSLLRYSACEAIGSVRTARSLRLRRTHPAAFLAIPARDWTILSASAEGLNLAVSDSISASACTERPPREASCCLPAELASPLTAAAVRTDRKTWKLQNCSGRLGPYTTRRQKVTLVAITVGNAIATLALTLPSIVIGNIVSQLTVDRAASIGYEVALLVGLFLLFAFLRAHYPYSTP